MIEKGTITKIENRLITVKAREHQGCRNCSSSFCSIQTREIQALNRDGLDLRPGDVVDLFLPSGKVVIAGFMVLIFPLLLFFAAYGLGGLLGIASDTARAFLGAAGLLAGISISYLLFRRNRERDYPIVLGPSSPADSEGPCCDSTEAAGYGV